MTYQAKSIRAFIGAKDYTESRKFYQELGFGEIQITPNMTLFKVNENLAFYLQDAYVKDWINNSMIFLEVDDIDACFKELIDKELHLKYESVRLSSIVKNDWGDECFLHDPSGVLWHFGAYKKNDSSD